MAYVVSRQSQLRQFKDIGSCRSGALGHPGTYLGLATQMIGTNLPTLKPLSSGSLLQKFAIPKSNNASALESRVDDGKLIYLLVIYRADLWFTLLFPVAVSFFLLLIMSVIVLSVYERRSIPPPWKRVDRR